MSISQLDYSATHHIEVCINSPKIKVHRGRYRFEASLNTKLNLYYLDLFNQFKCIS